ncbi:uncharacterized protein, partial [Clytia hemisphaerica]|uniref:uncharacterized protein n=1 Tax=Clytia hemisphaerica TaxID=252671 RepID=UPI0034D3D5DC
MYSKFKPDSISHAIFPSDKELKELSPVWCLGDGNCFYNAISMLLTGDNQLKYELRIKIAQELIVNRDFYDNENFRNYTGKDYDLEVEQSIKLGTYASITHLTALVNILGIKVRSIYPESDNSAVKRDFFNKIFNPLKDLHPTHCLTLMWSHTQNTEMFGWCPNHFVPCVLKDWLSFEYPSIVRKPTRKRTFETGIVGKPVVVDDGSDAEEEKIQNGKNKVNKVKFKKTDKKQHSASGTLNDYFSKINKKKPVVDQKLSLKKNVSNIKCETKSENSAQKLDIPIKKKKVTTTQKENKEPKTEKVNNIKCETKSENSAQKLDIPIKNKKVTTTQKENKEPKTEKVTKSKGSQSYDVKFSKEWTKIFNCVQPCSDGAINAFYCTVCSKKVNCSHQGIGDVKRHIDSKTHKEFARHLEKQPKIYQERPTDYKVIEAELRFALALLKHNATFAMADTLSPCIQKTFSESRVGKSYGSKKTKTTCLVNWALKPYYRSKLVNHMTSEPYALASDGSNDEGLIKMNPLLVRIFDVNEGKVVSRLLDMCVTKKSDAETLFNNIAEVLLADQLSWDNCVAISLDNTSVNVGKNNSIMTRVLDKNENIFVNGCPCHIIHNTASKGAEAFSNETDFDVEDFLVDLYYYFDKSSKRKVNLEDYCIFCDKDYQEIVKYVSTRWLSLERAVTRTLKMYKALKSYFLSVEDKGARFDRLVKAFNDQMTEVHLFFYQSALQVFIKFNMCLQRSDPLISRLHEQTNQFLTNLACKFIETESVFEKLDSLESLEFHDDENQKTSINILHFDQSKT